MLVALIWLLYRCVDSLLNYLCQFIHTTVCISELQFFRVCDYCCLSLCPVIRLSNFWVVNEVICVSLEWNLLCPRFQTSPHVWSVWQLVPSLDVVSYYLVAYSVLPLVHFGARKRKTNLRPPLPPIKIWKKPEIKISFQLRPNEQPAVNAQAGLQEQKRESMLQKISSEWWWVWFLFQKLILRQICKKKGDCALPGM